MSSCCLCVSVSADVTPTCLAAVYVCLLVLMSLHMCLAAVLVCLLVLMSLHHVSSCCPCLSVSADVTPPCV